MQDIIIPLSNNILPNIFWAIIIFIIGYLLSKKAGEITENLLKKLKLDQATKNLGWHHFFERYNAILNASKFFGIIVYVFCLLITLMVCFEILELTTLTEFLLNIVNYYPNILISSAIFIFAVFVAEFSKKIVFIGDKLKYTNALGVAISTATWVLSALAIMYQLKIVPDLVLTLFIGVTTALALTFGISLGLGSQDLVKKILKTIEKKIK
ncbi:MAG: hypothetical protein PHY30_01045 [Candidatus Pacebacteria bacterium]|nr:hypothetical protein [Candidatus Paceibacterota bacterium]